MTEQEYQELNDYLQNEFAYLQQTDDFFLNNMEIIRYLSNRYHDLVSSYDYVPVTSEQHVDEEIIYEYARKVVESISTDYLKIFDTLKKKQQLNFLEDNILGSHTKIIKDENGIQKIINISLSYSYYDVKKVIHEFIHYTNNQGDNPIVHNLGEFLSVYFELYTEKYLENEGISLSELQSSDRLEATYEYCEELLNIIDVLYIYQQMGTIDIKQIDDINNVIYISKEELEIKCKNLLEYFRKRNYNILKQLYGNKYSLICQYLFGTLLGVYAINNCKLEDIVYLNDHINDNNYNNEDNSVAIITLLQQIGIDLTDDEVIDEIFNCIEEYIKKINSKQR